MITEDQTSVIEFLGSPSTHAGSQVERIDTHISIVFLAGRTAFKLKRAVRLDYVDFSTCERRRTLCEAEVRVNRRTAPALYRGVVAVTREADGSLALHGRGTAVEWLVEMSRFPQDGLFDRLATTGRLDLELMRPLASGIAGLHLSADRRPDHGGSAGMSWVVRGNADGFAEFGHACLDQAAARHVIEASRRELERQAASLEHRRASGFVRECHGDLHLRNIVLLDGQPTLFDAVEFNDEISCTDTLYDLAFLLMDLWQRELPLHANVVWNHYLSITSDVAGAVLLPLFLSCRAAVRAKTNATASRLVHTPRRDLLEADARKYLALAGRLLEPAPPVLVAVGGLSGTGKSTLALGLAPLIGAVPGAVVLRTDEIRKQLSGVPLLERLRPEGYSAEMSERVYGTVAERAARLLGAGQSVIVDGVYARASDRTAIEAVAAAAAVPFAGLWLDAADTVLVARVESRRHDPSDADADVVRRQRRQDAGDVSWARVDASLDAGAVQARALALVRDRLGAG